MRAINITKMPATFRHAVLVTRRLKIKYIWIDSLCILQDSKEDWAIESHRMQNVYANAIVNISADNASGSTVGLLSGGKLPSGFKFGNSEDGDNVYVRTPFEHTDSSRISHVPKHESVENILDSRAWVVQERILSPRVLHFSKYEMAWECDTHTSCECTVLPRKPVGREFRKTLLNTLPDSSRATDTWNEIVSRYSATKLTFESDRLIAIAGLASRPAISWGRIYIAGLWKEDLLYQLLWCTMDGTPSYRCMNIFHRGLGHLFEQRFR
jgi:Heterokaryon incompatibility protein (HET)